MQILQSDFSESGATGKSGNWFKSSREWKPYGKIGHPGHTAKLDPRACKNAYCRKYYRENPEYARTLLKHPENLGQRLRLRELSPEEKAEHKKKVHREWSRKRNRQRRGADFNEKMSLRGRKGAEKRFGKTYDEPLA